MWEPGNRSVPGVLVHAQVLRTMLNGGLLQPLSVWLVYALALAGAALVLMRSGARATGLYALYIVLLGRRRSAAARRLVPAASRPRAGGHRRDLRALHERCARACSRARHAARRIRRLREPANHGRDPRRAHPSGSRSKRQRVCILFSDIRDFTTRSEFMAPEALIEMLNATSAR